MQLKIQRSQRNAAITGKVIFCVDARIFLTAEEQANVSRYRLGSQVIYNSQASRKHLERADVAGREGSYWKSLASVAMAAMNLNITIDSLQRGQHIECKDLDELLAAEEALMDACNLLRSYLQTASTFDGREVVVDFSGQEPQAVSKPVPLPPPVMPPPSVAPASQSAPPVLTAVPQPGPEGISAYAVPQSDPFEGIKNWWARLTPQQRMWCYGAVGLVIFILFIRTL